ncbi:MAG: TetR/AcrR family transcriptional regulator [Spirochaetia bacterium]|nr:TetR/AcrR family transcriptional regulator [Spirochaetia bacterium]
MAVKKRNLERTRAQIMAVAFEEIFRNGYQGVSVNDIVQKTDVTKGAFFHHFPTKQALGYAVVDETVRELTISRWIRPLAAYEIETYVKKAQKLGFVRKDVKARQVAEFIVMAHEGFFGIVKGLGGDKKVYYSLYESLRTYMEALKVRATA